MVLREADCVPGVLFFLTVAGVATLSFGNALAAPVRHRSSAQTRNVARSSNATHERPTAAAIDPAAGIIHTYAGGSADRGPAIQSSFSQPYDAALMPDGSIVVVDTYNNRVRVVDKQTGRVRTIAGSGDTGSGGDGGPATQASLNFPSSATVAADGSIYFSDTWNDSVRRVDAATGIITLVAGKGTADFSCTSVLDGQPATSASVCEPTAVVVDSNNNLYISETSGAASRIRRVDGQTGIITTAYTTSSSDGLPWGLALDGLGNLLFSESEYKIRYLNLLDHAVSVYPLGPAPVTVQPGADAVIAGGNGAAIDGDEGDGGVATSAKIDLEKSIHLATNGDILFSEESGAVVQCPECPGGAKYQWTELTRRIDAQTGIINSIAGNKTQGVGAESVPATQSALYSPEGTIDDGNGNVVIVDRGNSRLRTISKTDGTIATIAGANIDDVIPARQASLFKSIGVAAGPRGVYFTDPWNMRIRRVDRDGLIHTVAGSSLPCVRLGAATYPCGNDGLTDRGDGGPATAANFYEVTLGALSVSKNGLVAVLEGSWIHLINDSDKSMTLFPSSAQPLVLGPGIINSIATGNTNVPQTGSIDCRQARLGIAKDVSFAPNGDMIIAEAGTCRILRISAATGQISVITGQPVITVTEPLIGRITVPENYQDGPLDQARFLYPWSITVASEGTAIYVADLGNNRIRKIDLTLGQVTTVAGNGANGFTGDGGPAASAIISEPSSIRLAPDGAIVFMDFLNQRVRRIGTDGFINTVAGNGPTLLSGLLIATTGAMCSDFSSVPCGHYSGDDGPATSAQINLAQSLAVDSNDRIFIADTANSRIRVVNFGVPLVSVVSRKIHGSVGAFDLDLPLDGNGIECRSGGTTGDYTVVFTFENELTNVDRATVSSGTGSVTSSSIGSDPHQYIVNLNGVTNAQRIAVDLANVRDAVGDSSGIISMSMGVLIGDTNADRFADAVDVSQTKSQSGNAVTNSNFREDVNVDGFIDAIDVSLIKSKSGTALP
jgi:hypothetical protein